MFLTPNLGLPVAEPEDPTREYPTTVDAPAKAILDTVLGRANSTPAMHVDFALLSLPTGVTRLSGGNVLWTRGAPYVPTYDPATGLFTFPTAGIYYFTGLLSLANAGNPASVTMRPIGNNVGAVEGTYSAPYGPDASSISLAAGVVDIPTVNDQREVISYLTDTPANMVNAWTQFYYLGPPIA